MRISRILTTALAATVLGTTLPAIGAEPITLKLHHYVSATAPAHQNMLLPWAQRINAASGGRLNIEVHPAMALGGKPTDLVDQMRSGDVDMVWTSNSLTPGEFRRSEVFELPFVHTNNLTASNLAMRAMFDDYLADDYKNMKVLFTHVHTGQALNMVSKPVYTPDDIAGLTLHAPTRTSAWVVEALGGTAVGINTDAITTALSTQEIDGAFTAFDMAQHLGLEDVTRYRVEGRTSMRFGTTTFHLSMNEATWASLPGDLQQLFLDNSGEKWLREVARIWTNSDRLGIRAGKNNGNEHIELSSFEMAPFRSKLSSVIDRWTNDAKRQGVNGVRLVDKAREIITHYRLQKG